MGSFEALDWSVVIISEISLDDTEISFKHEMQFKVQGDKFR